MRNLLIIIFVFISNSSFSQTQHFDFSTSSYRTFTMLFDRNGKVADFKDDKNSSESYVEWDILINKKKLTGIIYGNQNEYTVYSILENETNGINTLYIQAYPKENISRKMTFQIFVNGQNNKYKVNIYDEIAAKEYLYW
jgi:hypothetical protein